MEGNELTSFRIISAAGSARSLFIEAIEAIRKNDLAKAEQLIEQGTEDFNKAHQEHASLIQREAAGEKIETDLLLVHAEDQIMGTETMKIIVDEMMAWAKDNRLRKD